MQDDELARLIELIGEDTRASTLRRALAVQARRGISFDEAWRRASHYLMGNRDGDGDWKEVWKFSRDYWAAAYTQDLSAWGRLADAARERQSAEASAEAA